MPFVGRDAQLLILVRIIIVDLLLLTTRLTSMLGRKHLTRIVLDLHRATPGRLLGRTFPVERSLRLPLLVRRLFVDLKAGVLYVLALRTRIVRRAVGRVFLLTLTTRRTMFDLALATTMVFIRLFLVPRSAVLVRWNRLVVGVVVVLVGVVAVVVVTGLVGRVVVLVGVGAARVWFATGVSIRIVFSTSVVGSCRLRRWAVMVAGWPTAGLLPRGRWLMCWLWPCLCWVRMFCGSVVKD